MGNSESQRPSDLFRKPKADIRCSKIRARSDRGQILMETLVMLCFFLALFGVLKKYSGHFVNMNSENRFPSSPVTTNKSRWNL